MHWLVPFERNRQFVGRHSQLEELFAKLDLEDLKDDCQHVAILGLGGVGKTQIALEAAFRTQKAYPDCSVFWISATSTANFEKGFYNIGQELQLPGINEDKADVKSLVRAFLSYRDAGRWLLIIDNFDDIEMLYSRTNKSDKSNDSPALANYLPFNRKGSILFTTRNLDTAVKQAGVDVITVREMSNAESLELLQTTLIDKSMMGGKHVAAKLLDNLAHLPLAIKQAAAYMNRNTMSVSDYLRLYEANNEDLVHLLCTELEDQGQYKEVKNPIASTWLISFRQISRWDPLAKEYLCFMSCVAHQDIPHSLLPPATRRKELEAIGMLKAYAFITKRDSQDSYDIHQLVQRAMRNWLDTKNELSLWSGKALIRVAEVLPFPEYKNRDTWTIYLPHAQSLLSFQEYSSESEESRRDLLFNVGEYFRISGKYKEAEQMHRQALEQKEALLGPEDLSTLSSVNDLPLMLDSQGNYGEAEQIRRPQSTPLKTQSFLLHVPKGSFKDIAKPTPQLRQHFPTKRIHAPPVGALVPGVHYNKSLMEAARIGDKATVQNLLLEKGVDPNLKDEDNWTPLHWAAWKGHDAVAKLLLETGADLNFKDNSNRTPLHWATRNRHEAVVKLLLEKGAKLNFKGEDKWAPLHWAAWNGHEALVKLLLKNGADPNVTDMLNWTPLDWAARNGYREVVQLLKAAAGF